MRGQRFAADIPTMPVIVDLTNRRPVQLLGDPHAPIMMGRGVRFAPRIGLELPGTSYANVDQLNTQIVGLCRSTIAAIPGINSLAPLLIPATASAADTKAMHDALAHYPDPLKPSGVGDFASAAVDVHDALKKPENAKLAAYWYDELNPFLVEWQKFQQDHSHWYDINTQIATGSETYQSFQKRYDALRDKAKSLGVKISADQAPIAKPTSIIDQIGKNALIAGGVLAGLILLVAAEK